MIVQYFEYIEENIDDDLIEGLSPDEYFKEDKLLAAMIAYNTKKY